MVSAEERGSETGAVSQDSDCLLCAVYSCGAAELVCDGHQVSSHHQPHRVCATAWH